MNSLFDRLGDMLKEYIEDDQDIFSKPAEEVLEDSTEENVDIEQEDEIFSSGTDKNTNPSYTKPNNEKSQSNPSGYSTPRQNGEDKQNTGKKFTFNTQNQQHTAFKKKSSNEYTIYKAPKPVPAQIRKDFDFFGLPLNATLDDCKVVYKQLLKLYHPDKHSSDPSKQKTATEYSARVNTAYKRLVEWLSADSTNKL